MSEVADQERWDEELRQETRRELTEKILKAVEGLVRYDIGQGESVHSGVEIIPHFYGTLLDRDEAIKAIKEATE